MHPQGAVSLMDSWVIGFDRSVLQLLSQLFYAHDLGVFNKFKET